MQLGVGDLIYLSRITSLHKLEFQFGSNHMIRLNRTPDLDFANLVKLKVAGTVRNPFMDRDLACLAGMSRLRSLNLNNAMITDEGCIQLGRRLNLVELSLSHTQVTDGGLQRLEDLRELKYLELEGARVTLAGVRQFTRAVPNCNVVF